MTFLTIALLGGGYFLSSGWIVASCLPSVRKSFTSSRKWRDFKGLSLTSSWRRPFRHQSKGRGDAFSFLYLHQVGLTRKMRHAMSLYLVRRKWIRWNPQIHSKYRINAENLATAMKKLPLFREPMVSSRPFHSTLLRLHGNSWKTSLKTWMAKTIVTCQHEQCHLNSMHLWINRWNRLLS